MPSRHFAAGLFLEQAERTMITESAFSTQGTTDLPARSVLSIGADCHAVTESIAPDLYGGRKLQQVFRCLSPNGSGRGSKAPILFIHMIQPTASTPIIDLASKASVNTP